MLQWDTKYKSVIGAKQLMKYEITIITKEDVKEKPLKKEIESLDGKILAVKSLGQKQFVYPIKKEAAGFYTVTSFEMEPTKILELNKKLGLSAEILRHLILVAKAATSATAKPKVSQPKPTKTIKKAVVQAPTPVKEIKEAPKKPAKIVKPKPVVIPGITKASKEIEAEETSTEERLKALDKKLDELLKE